MRIWRYTNLTKFISLLMTKSLYFSNVTTMEDHWEGATPDFDRLPLFNDDPFAYPPDQIEEMYVKLRIPHPETQIKVLREQMYINCWHLNDVESAAMWKLYSNANESIALVSSVDRLRKVLPKYIRKGEVEYIDYKTGHIGSASPYARFLRKRKSFEHEREFRAILWSQSPHFPGGTGKELPQGIFIPVPLERAFERVVVNPDSPKWFKNIVHDVATRYEMRLPVEQSDLGSPALF